MIELLIVAGHHVKFGVLATAALVGTLVAAAAEQTGTDPVLLVALAIIGGMPATIAAIGAIVIGLRNSTKVTAIAKSVDGVKTELVAATERAAKADGVAEGIATERANPQSPATDDGAARIVAAIEAAAVPADPSSPQPVEIVQPPGAAPVRVKTDKAPRP